MSLRVLVVEDEIKIARLLQNALETAGYLVELVHDGKAALAKILRVRYDVIVLDLMLPGQDGLSILREIRSKGISTPALAISARGDVGERVEGLNSGADDYLPKPFVLVEVLARVRALTRRRGDAQGDVLRVADLTLDRLKRTASRAGQSIELSAREYKLLEFLMRAGGQVCGRTDIIRHVWEYNFDPGTNLVDVYIMRLREKIDADFEGKLLHTIRGIGYALKELP